MNIKDVLDNKINKLDNKDSTEYALPTHTHGLLPAQHLGTGMVFSAAYTPSIYWDGSSLKANHNDPYYEFGTNQRASLLSVIVHTQGVQEYTLDEVIEGQSQAIRQASCFVEVTLVGGGGAGRGYDPNEGPEIFGGFGGSTGDPSYDSFYQHNLSKMILTAGVGGVSSPTAGYRLPTVSRAQFYVGGSSAAAYGAVATNGVNGGLSNNGGGTTHRINWQGVEEERHPVIITDLSTANVYARGGSGMSSIYGTGATGKVITTGSLAGEPGKGYGSGGSGAVRVSGTTPRDGGSGAGGLVIVKIWRV
jgi:hypothetical protein